MQDNELTPSECVACKSTIQGFFIPSLLPNFPYTYNMPAIHLQEKNIHKVFIVSLIIKGINSVLEIVGGILFLFTGTLTSILTFLTKGELIEDPTDYIATQIQHLLPYLSTHNQLYAAIHLLSHGIIKIILVINLLRNKTRAYPLTLVAISIFIFYQLYRLSLGYSLGLIILTIFDVFLLILTWHEYKIAKAQPKFSAEVKPQ